MLKKFLTATSVVLVLLYCILGYWYLAHPESWDQQFFTGFANAESEPLPLPPPVPATAPIPANPVLPPPPPSIPVARAPAAVSQPLPGSINSVAETGDIAPMCALPATTEVTRSSGSQLYSWRDENGLLNISDRPPPSGVAARTREISQGELQYFALDIQYPRNSIAFDIETPLKGQLNGIYQIFTSLLGFDALRKVQLNIVIHPDRDSYYRAASQAAGRDMSPYNGHYSSRDNQAVTYLQTHNDATMVTVRHEAVHVITTGMLGLTPPWLREGLAEYFEHLSAAGTSSRIDLDTNQLRIAQAQHRSGSRMRLADLLALQESTWHGEDQNVHYAMAGSLVYFLMEDPRRRQAFATLLQEISGKFCERIDTTARLNAAYPGGLTALEFQFFAWLDSGRARPTHNY